VIAYLLQIQLNSAMPPKSNLFAHVPSEISEISGNSLHKNARILTVLYRHRRQIVPRVPSTKPSEQCTPDQIRDVLGRCSPGRFIPKATSTKLSIIQTTNASLKEIITNEITSTTNQLPQPLIQPFDSRTTTGKTEPVSSADETTRSVSPTTIVTRHPTVPVVVVTVSSAKSEEPESSHSTGHEDNNHSVSDSNQSVQNDEVETIIVSSTAPTYSDNDQSSTSTSATTSASSTHQVPHKEHQRSIPDYVRTTHNCYGRDKTVLPSRAYEDYDY